jgi:hypothetical protein
MPLPVSTSTIDNTTGFAIPANTGTWGNLVAWDSWKNWNNLRANTMIVVSTITDRGTAGYFNIKTTADVTGNIAYSVYTSNTGAFAGEETVSNITPNTSNIAAFYGRYYSVVANVTDPSGAIELRSLNVTSTNSRFDIQFNDVDTGTLAAGPNNASSRVLPLSRTISAVTNMQVTAHNPTLQNSIYITTGNTGYVLDYNGPSTTLSNVVTSSGAVVEYLAMAVEENTTGLKVYKTIDGVTWNTLANLANTSSIGSTVAWNTAGDRLAAGFRTENDYNRLRTYTRSGDTFTKRKDPDTWPTDWVRKVAYSPNDSYLAVAMDSSPFIMIYNINGNNLTKLTNPATLPTGVVYSLAWDSTSTYLAVTSDATPFILVYKRSGNTFTKLANPAILPTSFGGAGTAIDFHPTGTHVVWAGIGGNNDPNSNGRVRLYYRSGDNFIMATTGNIDLGVNYTPFALNYNRTGTHFAIGSTGSGNPPDNSWYVYNQSGNTVANSAISVSSGLGPTFSALDWDPDGDHLFHGYSLNSVNPRGMDIYNVAYSGTGNANITLSTLAGVTSNVGNVRGVSSFITSYGAYIEVANAAIFSGAGGNIRINNESLSYLTANTTASPNRLESISRAVSTVQFGNSTANLHSIGSTVFPIETIDFTARYFATEAVGISNAYVDEKDRTLPTVVVRDNAGAYTDGVIDALLFVLPEQYMDDTNLGTR